MEKEQWIVKVMNSTNGITAVEPADDLWSKIQTRVQKETKVSPKTVWLVAASIAVLVLLNITALKTKVREKETNATTYLESTINQSNQLYQ